MIEPLGKVCPIDLELGFFGAQVRVKKQTSGKTIRSNLQFHHYYNF